MSEPVRAGAGDLAGLLSAISAQIERNERDPTFHRRMERLEEKRQAEEMERLRACAESALNGVFGRQAQDLAEDMLIDTSSFERRQREDRLSLLTFRNELRKIPPEQRQRREPRKGQP